MKTLILIIAVTLATFSSAFAQQRNPTLPNPAITSHYDRFKGRTTVRFKAGYLRDAVPRMSLDVFAFIDGEYSTDKAAFGLIFTSDSNDWVFLKSDNTLRVITDNGRPISLGEMKRGSGEVYRGSVIETLSLVISLDSLKRLAASKTVEMQVSQTEFELTSEQLRGLRDFVEMFTSKSGEK